MKSKGVKAALLDTSSWIGIIAIVVFCLAPFYWMIVSSLRPTRDIFDTTLWPREVSMENYVEVFKPDRLFTQSLLNSLIVAGVTTILALLVATFTAYALARLEFPGKTLVLTIVIASSMFPLVAIVVPLLKLFTQWEWINTYQSMIVPDLSFALPLAVWNLTSFFRQMPRELEQAAQVLQCLCPVTFNTAHPVHLPAAQTGHQRRAYHTCHRPAQYRPVPFRFIRAGTAHQYFIFPATAGHLPCLTSTLQKQIRHI